MPQICIYVWMTGQTVEMYLRCVRDMATCGQGLNLPQENVSDSPKGNLQLLGGAYSLLRTATHNPTL